MGWLKLQQVLAGESQEMSHPSRKRLDGTGGASVVNDPLGVPCQSFLGRMHGAEVSAWGPLWRGGGYSSCEPWSGAD